VGKTFITRISNILSPSMTIPALVLLLKFLTLTMTSWQVNDSPSWHSIHTVFVAERKRMQLSNYRKAAGHSVVQVVHKVFHVSHTFSMWLSQQVVPSTMVERNLVHISYSITLICDLVISSSPSTSYVLVNMHSQFRFHRMKYGVLDSHSWVTVSTILIINFLGYGVNSCIS